MAKCWCEVYSLVGIMIILNICCEIYLMLSFSDVTALRREGGGQVIQILSKTRILGDTSPLKTRWPYIQETLEQGRIQGRGLSGEGKRTSLILNFLQPPPLND